MINVSIDFVRITESEFKRISVSIESNPDHSLNFFKIHFMASHSSPCSLSLSPNMFFQTIFFLVFATVNVASVSEKVY